jgi:hypothetical protein
MADIGKLIADALYNQIVAECQTPYAANDPTRVNLVNRGEFQDDPEEYRTIVCVHRNDPDHTDRAGQSAWMDEQDLVEIGYVIGAGGQAASEFWFRRFTIEIIVWPGLSQTEADEINGTVVARIRRAATMLQLTNLADEFGETIVVGSNPIRRMKVNEGGGPPDEYSWKTFLYLEYKTNWTPL